MNASVNIKWKVNTRGATLPAKDIQAREKDLTKDNGSSTLFESLKGSYGGR